jgi:hypothetical protein
MELGIFMTCTELLQGEFYLKNSGDRAEIC